MELESSHFLASILGPILMVLTLSEYLNLKIWEQVHPTVVYLNGLFLLSAGLLVVRVHREWTASWSWLITLTGSLCILAGAYRMFFPKGKQASKNYLTDILLLCLFLIGGVLAYMGYFTKP